MSLSVATVVEEQIHVPSYRNASVHTCTCTTVSERKLPWHFGGTSTSWVVSSARPTRLLRGERHVGVGRGLRIYGEGSWWAGLLRQEVGREYLVGAASASSCARLLDWTKEIGPRSLISVASYAHPSYPVTNHITQNMLPPLLPTPHHPHIQGCHKLGFCLITRIYLEP